MGQLHPGLRNCACNKKNLVSQRELGAAYFRGTGAPVNTEAAVVWLRKEAERRDEAARLMLSECMRDKVSAFFKK